MLSFHAKRALVWQCAVMLLAIATRGVCAEPIADDWIWTLARLPDVHQRELPESFTFANQSLLDDTDVDNSRSVFVGYNIQAAAVITKPYLSFDPSLIRVQGNTLGLQTFSWRYEPSLQLSLSRELDSGFEVGLQFWQFGASARDTMSTGAGSFVVSRPVPTATSGLVAAGPNSMAADASLDIYSIDAMGGIRTRLLMMDSYFGMGIRYAEVAHRYNASVASDRLAAVQNLNGFGGVVFANFRYEMRDGFSIVMNNHTSISLSEYSYEAFQSTSSGTVRVRSSDNLLQQTLKSQLGIDWTGETPAGFVTVQVMWEMQEWYDTLQNSTGILGAQTGLRPHNLSFGGLAISAAIRR